MRWVALLLLPALVACGAKDEGKEIAAPRSVTPQAISFMDVDANKLHGPQCSYASGKSMGAVVMALEGEAVMKIDGKLRRFMLDPQCDKLEKGTGSRYIADGDVLDLAIDRATKSETGGKLGFQGSVKLTGADGAVLYQTDGAVQCGES